MSKWIPHRRPPPAIPQAKTSKWSVRTTLHPPIPLRIPRQRTAITRLQGAVTSRCRRTIRSPETDCDPTRACQPSLKYVVPGGSVPRGSRPYWPRTAPSHNHLPLFLDACEIDPPPPGHVGRGWPEKESRGSHPSPSGPPNSHPRAQHRGNAAIQRHTPTPTRVPSSGDRRLRATKGTGPVVLWGEGSEGTDTALHQTPTPPPSSCPLGGMHAQVRLSLGRGTPGPPPPPNQPPPPPQGSRLVGLVTRKTFLMPCCMQTKLRNINAVQGGGGGGREGDFGRGEFRGGNFAVKKSGENFPPAKFLRRVTNNFAVNSDACEYCESRHMQRCTRQRKGQRCVCFHPEPSRKLQDSWRSQNFPLPKSSPSKLSPGKLIPPPPL